MPSIKVLLRCIEANYNGCAIDQWKGNTYSFYLEMIEQTEIYYI